MRRQTSRGVVGTPTVFPRLARYTGWSYEFVPVEELGSAFSPADLLSAGDADVAVGSDGDKKGRVLRLHARLAALSVVLRTP